MKQLQRNLVNRPDLQRKLLSRCRSIFFRYVIAGALLALPVAMKAEPAFAARKPPIGAEICLGGKAPQVVLVEKPLQSSERQRLKQEKAKYKSHLKKNSLLDQCLGVPFLELLYFFQEKGMSETAATISALAAVFGPVLAGVSYLFYRTGKTFFRWQRRVLKTLSPALIETRELLAKVGFCLFGTAALLGLMVAIPTAISAFYILMMAAVVTAWAGIIGTVKICFEIISKGPVWSKVLLGAAVIAYIYFKNKEPPRPPTDKNAMPIGNITEKVDYTHPENAPGIGGDRPPFGNW